MLNIEKINQLINEVDKLSGNRMSDICDRNALPEENELRALQEQIKDICQREDIRAEIDGLKAQLDKALYMRPEEDAPVCIEWAAPFWTKCGPNFAMRQMMRRGA